jgi:hypothetical protein
MRFMSGALVALGVATMSVTTFAQNSRTVTAGKEYDTSGTVRTWFGSGYRDIWATPFNAPVLDLAREAGGLEPERQVGGLQTAGLAMRGADGRSYTFRSLHKEPERLLPAEWRTSWPAKIMRDATSATHPGAGVMVPVLAEAAGIPHSKPRLMVMPDDPRLGNFRATFANQLGTFEEFPTAGANGRPGFNGATEIISSTELWDRWLSGPASGINTRAMVRARILDLFIDNYDRRRGQWRWMRVPDRPDWQPLPEDPDMAFVKHNGIISSVMRSRQPQLIEFSDRYPGSLEGPTLLASEVDRWLLSGVDRDVYQDVARELQKAWSDQVLENVVAQLPQEWRAIDKGEIVQALKARRTGLPQYIERFYRVLARNVDVHLTNRSEVVTISTAPDGSTTISAAAEPEKPFFSRTFRAADTSEVRIYLHGGEDRIDRHGAGGPIHIRVIADGDLKTVESERARTEIWGAANQVNGERVSRRNPWVNPSPVPGGPWIEPRSSGSVTTWQPVAWYAADIGPTIGLSVVRTGYGFRTLPFAKEQAIKGGWAFGQSSGKLEYEGLFKRTASPIAFDLRALASGIEQINYFGLGNETVKVARAQYRSKQTMYAFEPALRVGSTSHFQMTLGPEIRHARSGQEAGTVLADEAPYGSGNFTAARLRTTIEADTRTLSRTSFLDLATPGVEPVDQPPGAGLRFLASMYIAPTALDVEETYGGVDGQLAAYFGTDDVQLAMRVGGARVFGDVYPYFDAAFIGASTNRGFRSQRFGGDASIFGNVELRAYLTPATTSVFPVRFGVMVFTDAGRVWMAGEDSREWHPSYGGGLLVKPVGTTIVFRAIAAQSSEGTLFQLGSGFRF